MINTLKKIGKILLISLSVILLLIVTLWLLLQTNPVQNWLIGKVTARLSKDLETKIEIKHVDFSLFNKMHLQGVLVEDRKKDTILNAGEVTVNVNDWFFVKDNIDLKYIGLKNAYIQLQRTDSVWRHQFLIDYFSSPASTTPKKKKAIALSLQDIDLTNILVKQKDGWYGRDMIFALKAFRTKPQKVDLAKKNIVLGTIDIDRPYVALSTYKGNKPPKIITTKSIDTSNVRWNPEGWVVTVEKLNIKNGTFKNDNGTLAATPNAFDGAHIAFNEINGGLQNVHWLQDTMRATVDLTTKERSGLIVKKLSAHAKVTPKEMTFDQLDLQTNDSRLQNYFSMKYSSFNDMSSFVEKVKLEGKFTGARVNSDDIAFFAPTLKTWKKKFLLHGYVSGPIAALVGKNLEINANNISFAGNASLTGLPNINETYINVEANSLKTSYKDAIDIIPALKKVDNPDLSKLQYVNFQGSFKGLINDFTTKGNIQTALGNLVADVKMKFAKGKNTVYDGKVTTSAFNLGVFLNNKDLGIISTETNLKGSGFDLKGNVGIRSKVNFIDFQKYRYQNIDLNGSLSKSLFDGIIRINDPNVQLSVNGIMNWQSKTPSFNFVSQIDLLRLKPIGFAKTNMVLTGAINANFTGKTIDDFIGKAQVSNAMLINNETRLSFDSLSLASNIIEGQKHLTIASNEFNAKLIGNFMINELPNAVTAFASRYYPSFIKPPAKKPANQVFTFELNTYNFQDFTSLIDSSLHGFNNSHIIGSIDTKSNTLSLEGEIPFFKYKNYQLNDARLMAIGNYDSIVLTGETSDVIIGDSLSFPEANFEVVAQNDVSKVKLLTGGSSTIDQASLYATVHTFNNGIKINFDPSSFIINGKTWTIQDDGELDFSNGKLMHGQLLVRETNQEVKIITLPSDVGNWNDISISLKNINLSDISPYFLAHNRLEGTASGDFLLENPGNDMKIVSQNFFGSAIRFDNDSIGNLQAKVVFDLATKELIVNGTTLNDQQKTLAYNIHLFLKDKESQKNNIISLNAHQFDLKYLTRFLGTLFSNIQGEVTGGFDIKGPLNELTVSGKGRLHNAGLKINFTQCYYALEDREIELKEDEINLNGFVLMDTVTNNPIYLQGSIMHNAFKNMFFDLTVSTRKPGTRDNQNNRPVQVLKTTYKDNKVFYGDVKATGSFALVGPQENTYMKIDAIASSTDQSNFTIAPSDSKAGSMPDWLVERKYGQAMADSIYKNTASNIEYELDITANRNVKMRFIMDDLTGDEIVGRGSGSLNIKAGTNAPLSIRGRYEIEEGNYNFTFQSFFKKPFEIKKGADNYISWSGSPTDAYINIEAVYKAEQVSFAPLSGINLDQTYANARENVYVDAILSGALFNPAFKFELELDANSKFNNDFAVSNALQQIQKNENEITRQVTYLIVFNSFAPPESGVSNMGLGSAVSTLTYTTLSSILFSQINNTLNSQLSKLLGNNVSVVFGGSVYNRNILSTSSSSFDVNQANLSGSLLIPLFKDRFVISLGSSMEVPIQSTIQQTVQFLPDVTLEWLINPSGTIRLNLFYRENLDLLTSSSTGAAKLKRAGGGISYKREFDNLKGIFGGKRKIVSKDSTLAK